MLPESPTQHKSNFDMLSLDTYPQSRGSSIQKGINKVSIKFKDGSTTNTKSSFILQSQPTDDDPPQVIQQGDPHNIDIRGSLLKPMTKKAFKVSYSKEFIRNMEQE